MIQRRFSAIPALLAALFLAGCTYVSTPATRTDFAMDTAISVTIYDKSDNDILTQTIALCKQYESIFSKTIQGSDIGRLNAAGGEPVTVSAVTMELLQMSREYSELSHGKFDITVAPVADLWNVTQDFPVIPKQEKIDAALQKVGIDNLTLTASAVENTASLANGARVDLGAIAKGYIAAKAAEFLQENGVHSAVINLGGDIYVLGQKNGAPFKIGIAYPFAQDGELLGSIRVGDMAVASSGVYERYFRMDGNLYHHIFDPKTGYPAHTDLYSVTILSPDAAQADALATVCILLGLDRSIELLKEIPGVCAVFVTSENEVYVTEGFTEKFAPEFHYDYMESVQ